MSKVCLISIPRTGSNHLCRTIQNFDSVASAYEIFNNQGAFGLNDFDLSFVNNEFEQSFESIKDQKLIEFFRENPVEVIDALEKSAHEQGKEHFIFKLFPKQLSDDKIIEMMSASDMKFSFIIRRCLDSYISYRKAVDNNVWHSQSTTDKLVEVQYADLIDWYSERKSWYDFCEKGLIDNDKSYSIICYERDIDCPHKKLLTSFRLNMRTIGVTVGEVYKVDIKGFTKQDKKDKIADKISNWEEFRKELHEKGMFFKALDYFL